MSEWETTIRPLAVLRALIDAVDRDILHLLSRRMGIVAEVAAYKRGHRRKIRDFDRERSVLDDRRTRAARLGLREGAIESIWRLLMMASREHQASLRAEVPVHIDPVTVAIIGGRGGMGRMMARLFEDLGHAVLIADLDTELSATEAARLADVTVISVPIDVTEAVIREVGPHVPKSSLMMDVTSLKTAPVAAMMASTEASVLGTHPMFGPNVHSLLGQRVVLCPGRGDAWEAWLAQMFAARGLETTRTDAEAHDQAMAVVQVLNHFQTQVFGLALARCGIPVEETLRFASPAYLMELYVAGRHFEQSPDLYSAIEMNNPRVEEVLQTFQQAAAEMAQTIRTQDRPRFRAIFDEVRRYYGKKFGREATEQSSFLIDRLVERS